VPDELDAPLRRILFLLALCFDLNSASGSVCCLMAGAVRSFIGQCFLFLEALAVDDQIDRLSVQSKNYRSTKVPSRLISIDYAPQIYTIEIEIDLLVESIKSIGRSISNPGDRSLESLGYWLPAT
jgi:hypothetical protein